MTDAYDNMPKESDPRQGIETNKNKNVKTISVLEGLEILSHVFDGKAEVLESLGKKGERLRLLPLPSRLSVHPIFFLTAPDDMRDVWHSNAYKLNKRGHAYNALRDVFGRGLIPIETGPEWKANQKVVGKYMQPKNIPDLEKHTYDYLDQMLDEINPDNQEDFVVSNVNESLIMMNFRLTAKSFLGRDATREEAVSVSDHIHTVNQFLLANAVLGGGPNFLYQSIPFFLKRVHEAEKAFKKYAQEIVEADTPLTGYMNALIEAGPNGSGQLTLEAQRDEVILAIISSYVSTATATGWALTFLSQPEFSYFQDIVRSEAEAGTVAHSTSVTTMIIKEVLRLYPPVFIMTRKATEDISVNNQLGPLQIPKGSSLFVSPYITQRNHEYWEQPTRFNPLRFQQPYNEMAYLPFGLGQRKCIGEHYALKVSALSLGHIFSKYQLDLLVSPHPMFRATLHPSHDFAVKAKKLN